MPITAVVFVVLNKVLLWWSHSTSLGIWVSVAAELPLVNIVSYVVFAIGGECLPDFGYTVHPFDLFQFWNGWLINFCKITICLRHSEINIRFF